MNPAVFLPLLLRGATFRKTDRLIAALGNGIPVLPWMSCLTVNMKGEGGFQRQDNGQRRKLISGGGTDTPSPARLPSSVSEFHSHLLPWRHPLYQGDSERHIHTSGHRTLFLAPVNGVLLSGQSWPGSVAQSLSSLFGNLKLHYLCCREYQISEVKWKFIHMKWEEYEDHKMSKGSIGYRAYE